MRWLNGKSSDWKNQVMRRAFSRTAPSRRILAGWGRRRASLASWPSLASMKDCQQSEGDGTGLTFFLDASVLTAVLSVPPRWSAQHAPRTHGGAIAKHALDSGCLARAEAA